jgi:hypothetical protein
LLAREDNGSGLLFLRSPARRRSRLGLWLGPWGRRVIHVVGWPMRWICIILVLLIGGAFIVGAALIPFSSERGRSWRQWLIIVASCLLVVLAYVMDLLGIILVLLIGGAFIVGAALIPFSSEYGRGWRRGLTIPASCLMVIGAAGFFGAVFSAVGGLNWLPNSFEWPVGCASGVITTAEGLHVVPHTPSGRIQVYNANWSFRTGWHVDAGAGAFRLLPSPNGRIEVITSRGRLHYVFDMDGRLISENTFQPESYGSLPEGESVIVPTAPWLWAFSSPGISWAVAVTGMVILGVMHTVGNRKAARGQPTDA